MDSEANKLVDRRTHQRKNANFVGVAMRGGPVTVSKGIVDLVHSRLRRRKMYPSFADLWSGLRESPFELD